jgi:hypothetical protein
MSVICFFFFFSDREEEETGSPKRLALLRWDTSDTRRRASSGGAAQEENSRGAQTRALAIYCLRCLLEMSVAFSLVGPGPRTSIPYNPSAADVALCRMSRGVPCAIAHRFSPILHRRPFHPPSPPPPPNHPLLLLLLLYDQYAGDAESAILGFFQGFFLLFSRWREMYICTVALCLLCFDQFNPAHL